MRADRRGTAGRTPPILMYHSVAVHDADPFHVTVAPVTLDRQLRLLRRAGLRGVAVGELLAAADAGRARGLVGLSFDDGYADFATDAVPVLRRHGCTATVYAIAGRLGGHNTWDQPGPRKELMTAEALRAVAAAGMEVGCHGGSHVRLSGLDAAALAEETARARGALTEAVGAEVTGFCYPYGDLDAAAVRAVADAGYDHACAIGRSELTGRHALPRTYIGDRDGALRLLAKHARHRLADARGPAVDLTARQQHGPHPDAARGAASPARERG